MSVSLLSVAMGILVAGVMDQRFWRKDPSPPQLSPGGAAEPVDTGEPMGKGLRRGGIWGGNGRWGKARVEFVSWG